MIPSTEEYGSLAQARAYVDTVRGRIGSLTPRELIEALDRIERAYREFPELALDRTLPCCSSVVTLSLSAAASLALDSRCCGNGEEALVGLLRRFRELGWADVEPIISELRREGRTDLILRIISEALDRLSFGDERSAAGFGDVLKDLLTAEQPQEIDGGKLAQLVRNVRRRLKGPPPGRHQPDSKEALLSIARRLRAPSPAPAKSHRDLAWPSGRLSFDEFLLQWPCEIELPTDLDDAAFIDEAYRAILLRGPEAPERDQYVKLLRDSAVSREWVIEDLLASEELHSLERRLRVVCGGRVITEPENSGQEEMPAVTWPSRSTG